MHIHFGDGGHARYLLFKGQDSRITRILISQGEFNDLSIQYQYFLRNNSRTLIKSMGASIDHILDNYGKNPRLWNIKRHFTL